MGWSPIHAASVAVVRNLTTGFLSPQFHVVFDPWFETVCETEEEVLPEEWDVLITNYRHENDLDPEDAQSQTLHDDWLSKEELMEQRATENEKRSSMMKTTSFSSPEDTTLQYSEVQNQ